ncbi:hypothetical protein ACFQT0_05740 [Hymenobacter humi]|uniref:MBG domain-containing protein n=1 Tax=Hymenobacter humi TaxID=1411620 RepID=A0ABW2U2D0_9BACT
MVTGVSAGPATISYTVAASGGCAEAKATKDVTINAAPSAAFSYSAASFCKTGTNPSPTVTGTAGGTFSAPSALSINPTTGVINLASSTVGGPYTVTYAVAASGGCAATSATASVTITAAPSAAFSYAGSPYCTSASDSQAAALAAGATTGTFSSTDGLILDASTGAITASASTPGTYTVTNTIAASGGCAAVTATTSVTINAAPSAVFSYAGSPYCKTGTNPTPTVTGTTGGTFSAPSALSINASTGVIDLANSAAGGPTPSRTPSPLAVAARPPRPRLVLPLLRRLKLPSHTQARLIARPPLPLQRQWAQAPLRARSRLLPQA